MAPKKLQSPVGVLSALALVGQLGLIMAVATVGSVMMGAALDRWLGSGGGAVALMIPLGIGAGAYAVYRILRKELK